jgi:hypothetical protein
LPAVQSDLDALTLLVTIADDPIECFGAYGKRSFLDCDLAAGRAKSLPELSAKLVCFAERRVCCIDSF